MQSIRAFKESWNPRRITELMAVLAGIAMLLLAVSCGPTPPQKGTPLYYWSGARETFAAGDYMKTIDHLDGLLNLTENDYTARAMTWELLLTSGLANGYMELENKYQAGGKANKKAPGDFFRYVGNYRSLANRLTLHFAETFGNFRTNVKGDTVPVDVPLPPGTLAAVGQLETVAQGNLLPAAMAETTERRALERGILQAIARAAGAPDDAAKAEQILKTTEGKVPRATFLLAMANTLYDESQLYARNKVNDSEKMKILCQRAQEVLAGLPESFETKDLGVKIRLALKDLGTT